MPFDAEIELPAPPTTRTNPNMERLIEHLEVLDSRAYSWYDPDTCVIGQARRLMPRQPYIAPSKVYRWLGISNEDGDNIFSYNSEKLRTPKAAVRYLRRLTETGRVEGYAERPKTLLQRIFGR